MIPFNPAIFLYLFILDLILWVTPLFIIITLMIIGRIFYVAHKDNLPLWRSFFQRKIFACFSIIIFIMTGILSFTSYGAIRLKSELSALNSGEAYEKYEQQAQNQKKRQNFVLEHDHLYGEFLFPKGTLINRYDPGDSGEETYPLILSGLQAAQFSGPIEFAGILTTRIEARGLVELAEDQEVGPMHYYSSNYGEYGGWVVDRTIPTLFCPKGAVALFEKPSDPNTNYDEPFWWREKDGVDAYFKPSEWQFRECGNRVSIDILPAFGSKEALAIEEIKAAKSAQEKYTTQTIVKNGVLMDAEPIEFSISFYLEAIGQYQFTAQKTGLERDYQQAFQLFEQAANNGEQEAFYYLGVMNLEGQGVPKNREAALYWLHKAVEIGDQRAIGKIGQLYLEDEVLKDYRQALDIFNTAAEQGHQTAQFYLGKMYAQGLGVEQNYQTALEWLKKASHPQHHFGMAGRNPLEITALINVGRIYAEGLGVKQDAHAAEPWFEKACYLGADQACELWETVKKP